MTAFFSHSAEKRFSKALLAPPVQLLVETLRIFLAFSILGNEAAIALVAGWPFREKLNKIGSATCTEEMCAYPSILDEMRRSFQKFSILHKYHTEPMSVDNDFYFRLGLMHPSPPDYSQRRHVEDTIKRFLCTAKPVVIEIKASDVYLASFQDETLLPKSTEVWSIGDSRVTPQFIRDLYKDS